MWNGLLSPNNLLEHNQYPWNLQFRWNIAGKSKVQKIFDGEMVIRTKPTNLLQIFCKIILNFKVTVKSIIDPDDNVKRSPLT